MPKILPQVLPVLLTATFVFCLARVGMAPASDGGAAQGSALTADVAGHLDDSSPVSRYTACLVLAALPASEVSLSSLKRYGGGSAKIADRVCAAYAVADLTQEAAAVERFVAAYPGDSTVAALWRRHESAGYPLSVAPPPQRYLAELARQNDVALRKLLAGLPHADGAHGEALVDVIADLYAAQARRVEAAGETLGVDLEIVRRTVSWRKQHDE